MEIYLDNSATTQVFPQVAELMTKIMCEDYGNSSSLHLKGMEAESYLRYAKETLSRILKVNGKEIIFTSGGTESDNLALIGAAYANQRKGRHLITTQVEHPAVANTMRYLEANQFRVTYLPVDISGRIHLEDLEKALTPETTLVSIMHTNNEIGSLMPIAQAGELIKKICPSACYHVDAVQGFGKAILHPKSMKIDLLSVSSHKIHGPKGAGFLFADEKIHLAPLFFGGSQQQGIRPGTENVPGAAGMAKAAEMVYAHLEEDVSYVRHLKNKLIEGIRRIEGSQINGLVPSAIAGEETAPHIVSMSLYGIRSEVMLHALEEKGVYVSAGSACAARKPKPSATLKAIGLPANLLDSTIRFSLSILNTEEEIDYTLRTMYDMIPMLRRYGRK
ncbi:MAG: cysteine desulfurase [Lachnospiraceae bacterium]|nr:cysteine desulfurase [Lachnospiraceae bacterium]